MSEDKTTKIGRPTKYREQYNEQAYKLCLLGYSNAELADFFQVDERTIDNWLNAHEDFLRAVTRGKDIADGEVVSAFYKRALGYDYTEVREKEGDAGTEVTTIRKHMPADTGAAMNWLSNRQRKKWRKDPKVSIEIKTDEITDEELEAKINDLKGRE